MALFQRQRPHSVDPNDLPPTRIQKVWRFAKNNVEKGFLNTRKFVRAHRVGLTFATLMTISAIGGFCVGNALHPVQTSVQKFEIFAQKYSLKLPKETIASVYTGKTMKFEVANKPYYVLTEGTKGSNYWLLRDALSATGLDSQFVDVSLDSVKADTSRNVIALLEPNYYIGFWGSPKLEKIKEKTIPRKIVDTHFDPYTPYNSWDYYPPPDQRLVQVSYLWSDDSKPLSDSLVIVCATQDEKLRTLRLASDLENSKFKTTTTIYSETEARQKSTKIKEISSAPEAGEFNQPKFEKDSFFGRFYVWNQAFIFMYWIGVQVSKLITRKWRKGGYP